MFEGAYIVNTDIAQENLTRYAVSF
jgi:hypothetical protein